MKVSRACELCGKPFDTYEGLLAKGRGKFCSQDCSLVATGAKKTARGMDERLWGRLVVVGDCWQWTGATHRRGHGFLTLPGRRRVAAHRLAYELAHGPIPDGKLVLHKCDNPPCCNPAHLYAGTASDNTRDMVTRERQARGERHGCARLTETDVRAIRQSLRRGEEGNAIAARFAVSPVTISDIKRRATWAWLR